MQQQRLTRADRQREQAGRSTAPAIPCRPRATINICGVVDIAASSEAAANAPAPTIIMRRRPNRSPSTPVTISDAAIRNP